MVHGVLDRIEDGVATILIEELNKEITIFEADLPDGSKEGTWFLLNNKNGHFTISEIDVQKTNREQQTTENLMNELKRRKRTSKFKRK